MVLALALPAALTGRNLLVAMTFGVVLASILVQGLTMPFVLRRLGVVNDEEAREEYDLARGRLQVATRLRAEVDRMRQMNAAPPDVLDALAAAYGARHDAARDELRSMHRERDDLREEAASSAIEHLLRLEKAELSDRLRRGLISRDAYDTMSRDADERLMHLRRRSFSTVEEVLDFAAGSLSGRPEESQPDIPR